MRPPQASCIRRGCGFEPWITAVFAQSPLPTVHLARRVTGHLRGAFDRPFAPALRGRRAGRGLGRGRALRHDAPMLAQARRQAGPQPAALLGLVRRRRRHGALDGALDRLRQLGDGAERSDAGGSLRSGALAGAGPLRGADRGRAPLFREPRAPAPLRAIRSCRGRASVRLRRGPVRGTRRSGSQYRITGRSRRRRASASTRVRSNPRRRRCAVPGSWSGRTPR